MRTLLALIFTSLLSIAYAEPQNMLPLKAAQDLDYAQYSRARKAKKIVEKYQKLMNDELMQATKDENELIAKLEKQYNFRLFDEKGQPVDLVDPDTGKITRSTTNKK